MKIIGIIATPKKEEIDNINRVAFEYVEVIEKSGAIPIIIPCNIKNISNYINLCEGFVIPGGNDIDPSFYNEEFDGARDTNKNNDKFLLNFIDKIIDSGKPLFGICKGMQLINVYFGGNLIQDLENSNFHNNYKAQYQEIDSIKIKNNSFLEEIFGKENLEINSIHHQAIKNLGKYLKIVANSNFDKTIEAIEHENKKIFGVQWHPECLVNHQKIFNWFISQID